MGFWYLYSDDGQHLGPVPTEYVARAVKSGAVPLDRWVTEANQTAWRPVREVPAIYSLVHMTPPPRMRDREATIVANADAFPTFDEPPTQKEVPSSDRDAEASERTLIAPAAFQQEMAEIDAGDAPDAPTQAVPRRPAAGMPAGSGRQGGFPPPAAGYASSFKEDSTLRTPGAPHDSFGSTQRSPDVPPGIVGRPIPAVLDRASGPPRVPPGLENGDPLAAPPSPTPHPQAGTTIGRNGPVIAFFLGGLALGAIVVVAMLVWAFGGGLLSR